MDPTVALILRYAHILGAALWIGGYAVLAFALAPRLAERSNDGTVRAGLTAARVASIGGILTILMGFGMISAARGFASLFSTTWGILVIVALVLAIVLMGVGDGMLRPAIRRSGEGRSDAAAAAARFATIGFVLSIVALAIMVYLPRAV